MEIIGVLFLVIMLVGAVAGMGAFPLGPVEIIAIPVALIVLVFIVFFAARVGIGAGRVPGMFVRWLLRRKKGRE